MIHILKNFFTFTYIAFEPRDHDAVIIDPAWNHTMITKHLETLNLRAILLTHHHLDHVNLADILAAERDVPVFMAQSEIDYYGFSCRNLQGIAADSTLDLGRLRVDAIGTPGHTKGGMCYQFEKCLFSGDTVFMEGCGMCNADGGDPYEMFESIQKLKVMVEDDVQVFPGHSYGIPPGGTVAYLRKTNVYFDFTSSEHFVAFRMRKGQKGLLDFK